MKIKDVIYEIEGTLENEMDTFDDGGKTDKNCEGWIEALKYVLGLLKPKEEPEPVKPPTNFDHIESLNFIWDKLHGYREDCIPESNPDYDEEWSDICISMAWIEDQCGVKRVEGILEEK